MTTINLSTTRLVNFSAVVTPQGVQAPSLNTGLVLGTSRVIDVIERMRDYDSLTAVAVDFGTVCEEYYSAQAWFGQSPQPTSLNIGLWANADTPGQLVGGPLSAADQLLAAWTSINNGGFAITINGVGPQQIGNLDFTGQSTFAGIAEVIESGFPGGVVTVAWNPTYEQFTATTIATGPGASLSFASPPIAGTDISSMLVWDSAANNGAYIANGIAAESALSAVVIFDESFGGQWYNCFIPSAADTDFEAIAPYFDGDTNPHFLAVNTQEAAVLTSGDNTNIGYKLQQLMSQHAAVQYSSESPYAAWSMIARIATVNWAGSNTAISLFYKQEPGIVAENLTDTQVTNIESYNVNVYVNYTNGPTIIEPGVCPSGQFIDTIVGVDGLRTQCATNVLNILLGQTTKVPQTDAGVATLETGAESACNQYVANGFLAPGTWNSSGFGTLVYGAFLDKGYYIYAPSVATQTEATRAERISPPISVAAKLAGAIDLVSGTIYVNQ